MQSRKTTAKSIYRHLRVEDTVEGVKQKLLASNPTYFLFLATIAGTTLIMTKHRSG